MTYTEQSLIVSLLLGDGHITSEGRICINHSEKHKEYIEYKANLLYNIIGGKPIKVHKSKSVINNKVYNTYSIRKCNKKLLGPFRDLLYPKGRKYISRKVLEMLTLEGIAIWYMDDGSLSAEKTDGKIHAYKLGLATYLSYEENKVIVDYFKEKWDIHFNIHKDGSKYRLRMGTKEARKFINLVKPYVSKIKCMQYKVLDI